MEPNLEREDFAERPNLEGEDFAEGPNFNGKDFAERLKIWQGLQYRSKPSATLLHLVIVFGDILLIILIIFFGIQIASFWPLTKHVPSSALILKND